MRAVMLEHYTRTARIYLRGALGTTPLSRSGPLVVQDFFDGLRARGLSPGVIRNVHAVLSSAFRYAVLKKLLKENHAAGVDKPKLRQKPLPAMTERSFCSLLRRAGISAKRVSEQMGHTNVSFTEKTYRTVYDSAKREMSDKLESVLSGGLHTGGTQ